MRTSAVDVVLLATGATLWILIFLIVAFCGAHIVRQAKRISRARAAADADAERVAAEFAVAMGEPAPVPPLSRRRLPTRLLLTEAAYPPLPVPTPPPGLSLAQIEEAAPCSKSPRGTTCSICLDEVDEGAQQRALPCLHRFHPECIRLWISRANRCPQCQAEILPATKLDSTVVHAGEEEDDESLPASRRARAAAAFQSLRDRILLSSPVSQGPNDEQSRLEQQSQE